MSIFCKIALTVLVIIVYFEWFVINLNDTPLYNQNDKAYCDVQVHTYFTFHTYLR